MSSGASRAPDTVRPIESRSLSEQVTTELRRSILSGALAAGVRACLCANWPTQLGVSFIPVRDALRVLEGRRT